MERRPPPRPPSIPDVREPYGPSERRTLTEPFPAPPPPPTKVSSKPPSGFQATWGNVSFKGSGQAALFVLGFACAGAGGYLVGHYWPPPTAVQREHDDQLAALRSALGAVRSDCAQNHRELVAKLDAFIVTSAHNTAVIAATIEEIKPGAKLGWKDGAAPERVEFHERPLNKRAPSVQPKALLVNPLPPKP